MIQLQPQPTIQIRLKDGLSLRVPVYPQCDPTSDAKDVAEFCPKGHRATIVEKFRHHSCLHPIIPLDNEAGSLLTADEIYEGAVRDLWEYCYHHGLRQVWSYMWNCWYERSKWCLWARSQNSFIPPIRTTMIAESFW